MSAASRLCPCRSQSAYTACCAPFHRGIAEASSPESLVRSRYAAFATKNADYIVRTLHADHADRALAQDQLLHAIRVAGGAHKYMGLTVLDREGADSDGFAHVLFFAKVFRRGNDVSFTELSDFAHDGTGWRYLSGRALVGGAGGDTRVQTIAAFRDHPLARQSK